MKITVKKLTDVDLMRRACEMTMKGHKSNATLKDMYSCEHSPIRCMLFWVEMIGIKTFASVHFTRHKIGVEHFVMSNREDRGGEKEVNRNTLVNHGMLINAQALINMARKRLCKKAHPETLKTFKKICNEIKKIDPDLYIAMVPECVYRRKCHELKSCGWYKFLFE